MMGGPTFSALPDVGVELAQAGLDKTLADIKTKHKNTKHQFKTLSAFNTLTDEIREVAAREKIDLIVMGTQGATGAKEIFLGTRTVYVIRKSKVPVLVIPLNYAFKEIKSIVFSTDYANPFNEKELLFLAYAVKMHKAKLIVLNVKEDYKLTDDQIANRESLTGHFQGLEPIFEQVKGNDMPNTIHEYIHQREIGLLAMMNRKHSFFGKLIAKPTIDSIGYHTQIPFLVMRDTWVQPVKK